MLEINLYLCATFVRRVANHKMLKIKIIAKILIIKQYLYDYYSIRHQDWYVR